MSGSVQDSEPQTRRRTQQPDVPHGLLPKRSPCSRRVGCESYGMAAVSRLQRSPAGESCAKSTFGTFGTCQIPARGIPCKTPRRSFSILMMHGSAPASLRSSCASTRSPSVGRCASVVCFSSSSRSLPSRRCDRDAVRVDRRRTTKQGRRSRGRPSAQTPVSRAACDSSLVQTTMSRSVLH